MFDFRIWGRDAQKAAALAERLAEAGHRATAHGDTSAALDGADAVITTTPSAAPLFSSGAIQPGTHITAIGADSPGKRELPTDLVQAADVLVCDSLRQSLNHGEFQHSASAPGLGQVHELGAVLSGAVAGRSSDTQITIADLTGIAAQDIAVVQSVLSSNSSQESRP